jgi:hypothetical protein
MNDPTLEDAFFELVTASEKPDLKKLQDVIARYPHFERELVEFATAWVEQGLLKARPRGARRTKALKRGQSRRATLDC